MESLTSSLGGTCLLLYRRSQGGVGGVYKPHPNGKGPALQKCGIHQMPDTGVFASDRNGQLRWDWISEIEVLMSNLWLTGQRAI